MRLMHTPLPAFYEKMEAAGQKNHPEMKVTVHGLEGFDTAKLASLRVGRIEHEVEEISNIDGVKKIEVIGIPYNPEIYYTFVIKGYREDGSCPMCMLENMYLTVPSLECATYDAEVVDDRRKITINDVEHGILTKKEG